MTTEIKTVNAALNMILTLSSMVGCSPSLLTGMLLYVTVGLTLA